MSVSASGKLAPASTADLAAGAQIPLVRLDGADQALLDELLRTVAGVATRGAFTLGDEVEAF
jgi:hypothetical protein